jgi:hypothetical protein
LNFLQQRMRLFCKEYMYAVNMNTNLIFHLQIIDESASDIRYLDSVSGDIASAIVKSYLGGLTIGHVVSLGFSLTGLVAGLMIQEVKL